MRILSWLVYSFALSQAWGQPYTFVRAVGGNLQRPDGAGAFNVPLLTQPALEGNYVVFREHGVANGFPTIWAHNLADGSYRKLVDRQTPAPGGMGNFTNLMSDSNPLLKNGIVTFIARDQRPGAINQGIYTVPVTGGPVVSVANYNTNSPAGGPFQNIDTASKPLGGFSADGRVVFTSRSTGGFGVYAADADGSRLTAIADSRRPIRPRSVFPINNFHNAAISGNTVVFAGSTVFDTSTGFIGLYTTTANGATGNLADGSPDFTEIFTSERELPGNANTPFHTRINIPSIQFDGTTVAFIADDTRSRPSYRGIFTIPVGGGAVTRIAASDSSLPGLGALNPLQSFGFCLNRGRVVFHAQDMTGGSPGNHGLYLWQNGSITRIIGTGDMIDGSRVTGMEPPGPYCMDGGRFAIPFGVPGLGWSIYVATPADPAIRVTGVANSASYSSASISPGGIFTIFGAAFGPPTVETFTINSANRMNNSISNSRYLINGSPAPPLYVSANQSSVVAPFGLGLGTTADVIALYNGVPSPPFRIPVAATGPGLFSADATGAGQGAIINQDGTLNGAVPAAKGSVVSIFGTGHGRPDPALVEGQITPVQAIPRLTGAAGIVTVTIDGQTAQVFYAGPAPGLIAGVLQVNAAIPANAPSGDLPVVVRIGGVASQDGLTVSVH